MTDALSIYLNDHLAGAKNAIELLDRLREAHRGDSLGHLADRIYKEVEVDRGILQRLSEAIGTGGSTIKEAGAWLAERATRLKLRLGADVDLGEFETLEYLSLGILGKRKLWLALSQISSSNPHLREMDFDKLIARADEQHAEIESFRLMAARKALARDTSDDVKDRKPQQKTAAEHQPHAGQPAS